MRNRVEPNSLPNNHVHLRRNVLDSRGGDDSNGLLYRRCDHLAHLHRDMLNGALRNFDHCLFDDGVTGENREIRFGDDFELHPGNFGEHFGEFLVDNNDDKDTILIAESGAKVEFAEDVFFAVGALTFGNDPEAILNSDVLA